VRSQDRTDCAHSESDLTTDMRMTGLPFVKESGDTMRPYQIDHRIAVRVVPEHEFGMLDRSCSLCNLSKAVYHAAQTRRSKVVDSNGSESLTTRCLCLLRRTT